MGIPTETTIGTDAVERVATLRLVRVVDYEKLAEENGGQVTTEQIKTAGDFQIVIQPNGRGAKEARYPVGSEVEGNAFLTGFRAYAELKKRKPRKPNANGKLEQMTKPELVALAAKKKIDVSGAKTKPELVAAIAAAAN